jgi:hypothetical protein
VGAAGEWLTRARRWRADYFRACGALAALYRGRSTRTLDRMDRISPFSVTAYVRGAQSPTRAFWIFWLGGTLLLSLLYSKLESALPHSNPLSEWPLFRWMGFTLLCSWFGFVVVCRCSRDSPYSLTVVACGAANAIVSMVLAPWLVPIIGLLFRQT